MSASCNHNTSFEGVSAEYKRRLWIVIAINGLMFLVEIIAGRIAESKALQADALDFLGDFLTYALSLAVIGMPLRTRANVALIKGFSLLLMGGWILSSTAYQIFYSLSLSLYSSNGLQETLPEAQTMGVVGLMALIANLVSVLVLVRYKDGDANVRSVWLCSRNDAIGNVAVMLAALGVWGTSTSWPDYIVATIMASLFLYSSFQIITQAHKERRSLHEVKEPNGEN